MKRILLIVTVAMVIAGIISLTACYDESDYEDVQADWDSLVYELEEVISTFNDLDVDVFGSSEQHDAIASEITNLKDRVNEMAGVINDEGGFSGLSDEDLDYLRELIPEVRSSLETIMETFESLGDY